jgi:MFS family permease
MLALRNPVNVWTQLIPGIILFGLGLSMTVAPLTSAILGDIAPEHAGIGSAINNAVARIAGLLAIAFAGVITGGNIDLDGLQLALIWTAGLLIISGALSAVGISNAKALKRAAQAASD